MGTSMTDRQIQLIAPRFAGIVVLALDTDDAGQSAARRSLEVARQALSRDYAGRLSVDLRILHLPAGKDPDDFLRKSPGEWDALVANAQAVADYVIETETAELPRNSSLQEREAAALRVLPILTASENNLYKQENIQKLARQLNFSERDLLALAQANAPAERRAPPPDDMPPPEYWADEFDPLVSEQQPADEIRVTARAIESYCLSLLLKRPNLLYLVNRKLRELADDDDDLLRGPLRELGADDFTGSHYRILMAHFQDSMAQDDKEPLDYLASAVNEDLVAEFDALLVAAPEAVSQSMRRNFQVDLNDIFRRRRPPGRANFSENDEFVCRALQLRLERLERERIELQYLQEEAQSGADGEQSHVAGLNEKIMLSLRAKARINLAVSRNALPMQRTSIA